jgi:hypothetical protein
MPTLSPKTTPYYGGGQVVNPADVLQVTSAPTTANVSHNVGTIAVDTVAYNAYMLMGKPNGVADWNLIGGSSSGFTGITGDTGTATPSAGTLKIAGTSNQITSTASSHTVTLTLPAAVTAPGSLTTTTGLVAGNALTVTTGDATLTAGNMIVNGAAKQLRVHGGAATDFIGETTLISGTKTISNTNIATADRIFLSRRSINSSTALGSLTYSISNGTSFTITAVDPGTPANTITADVSIVEYFIVRQV